MHKYFVFDTTSGEGREFGAFSRLETLNRLNQSDSPDRDQILEVFAGVVEFLDIVNTTRCISKNWIFT